MRGHILRNSLAFAALLAVPLAAAGPDRDFSGEWLLDSAASSTQSLGPVETRLTVLQGPGGILCSTGAAQWSYALDGSETRKRVGEESRSSMTKWEGSALLINTLVSGAQNYTVMDRWKLSRDRNTLTIERHIVRGTREVEGTLVFRREGVPAPEPSPAEPASPAGPRWRSSAAGDRPEPSLVRRPEPAQPADIIVPQGSRVLLTLVNELSTKRAQEGDRVYLRTAAPIAAGGRVIIPRGSDVMGSVTRTKPAGKVKGKGELFIRFDSLILPNGVARDFTARPPGKEGEVDGGRRTADGGTVMAGAGMGATVGAITRGLGGAAVGGAAGALAGVLMSRRQDVVLPAGTHVEMVLDRDLVFRSDELPYWQH
jgi:type IV secretion system protein VirB10